jgi:hypothetical protein
MVVVLVHFADWFILPMRTGIVRVFLIFLRIMTSSVEFKLREPLFLDFLTMHVLFIDSAMLEHVVPKSLESQPMVQMTSHMFNLRIRSSRYMAVWLHA